MTRRAEGVDPIYTHHEWNQWMDAIIVEGVNLTSWEEDFVESIRLVLDTNRPLTYNQEQVLERIYSTRTR